MFSNYFICFFLAHVVLLTQQNAIIPNNANANLEEEPIGWDDMEVSGYWMSANKVDATIVCNQQADDGFLCKTALKKFSQCFMSLLPMKGQDCANISIQERPPKDQQCFQLFVELVKILTKADSSRDARNIMQNSGLLPIEVYEGGTKDGLAHGEGKMTYANGAIYQGSWRNGIKHGKGRMTGPRGETFVGEWTNDLVFHGNGRMSLACGEWKNGQPQGGMHEAEVENANLHRKKRLALPGDSDQNNKPQRRGKLTFPGGELYEGDIKNNDAHGKGRYTWPDGSVYEGDFIDGKRTGKGRYTWLDGSVYEGDFIDGKPTGKGRYSQPDGGVYEGDFIDGKKTGKGRLTGPDGSVYEGDFKNNEPHGKGKGTLADGEVLEGDFVKGEWQRKVKKPRPGL